MGISFPSAICLRDCPVPVCIFGAFVEDQWTTCTALFQDSWQWSRGYDTKSAGNRNKIKKWEYIKLKYFCTTKYAIYRAKRQAAAAKSLQLCPTLCDPIDGSTPGSPVPGTLQARTVEWVAISFSNAWRWKVKVKLLSRVWLFTTPRTAAYQAPPSMGFSRQEYWSGVPSPSPYKVLNIC